MNSGITKLRAAQILLTLGALEFFGPILRDTNASHLLNPDWVGHARFHLMWNLMLWLALGAYSLYLIWRTRPNKLTDLYLVLLLQIFNAFAFWGAVVLGPAYAAEIFDVKIHFGFMNVNENIIVFTVLSALAVLNWALLRSCAAEQSGAQS